MSDRPDSVDIAVVGGGLLGTPLAMMLASAGWRVALLEQHAIDNPHHTLAVGSGSATDSLRQHCIALSAATRQILLQAGLWDCVADDACAIDAVHVSHSGYFGTTRISAREAAVAALGYVVDNATFMQGMHHELQSSSVFTISPARVDAVEMTSSHAGIRYRIDSEERILRCRLLIAVDGASSMLRESAGIRTTHTDYDQVAVMGMVQLPASHHHVAYERFTPTGPLAMLPRPGNTASFVYCIDAEMQAELEAMDSETFMLALQSAFGFRLGRFEALSDRRFIPLVKIEANSQVGDRLLLMGNAARLLHPVAGQGFNLAMRDVAGLLEQLAGGAGAIGDPGTRAQLQAFVESRSADQQRTVRMTDLLARTFRGRARVPSHMRALALLGLDSIEPARRRFARQSMGFAR